MNNRSAFSLLPIVMVMFLCNTTSYSQTNESYPGKINDRIEQVENNLIAWVKLDSICNWNILQRMKDLHVNGVSIAVINHNKIEWIKSYGLADTTEKRPVTNQTLFQAASIGKSINGLAFMKLAQDKRLNLNNDINAYLKTWHFPYDTIAHNKMITLADILSHTAGLNVHGFDGYKWNAPLPSLKQILDGERPAHNAAVRSAFEPGLKFQYSGGGYEISELLLEDITGGGYSTYIERNIFAKLDMANSTYNPMPAPYKCATAYRFDGQQIGCKYHLYPEKACGAGLWTTATDLAKTIIEVQLSLKGKSNKIINKEFAKLMLTPHLDSSNYGFGFFVEKKGKEVYFQHSGLNEGFSSQYYGSVKDGKGVVVLINSDNSSIISEIANSVATVYNWKDFYNYASKKIITVPDSTLNKYVGCYKFQHEDTGPLIIREQANLYLQTPDSPTRWRMYFTSTTEFFMLEAPWANQQFFMDEVGNVKGHYILGNGHKEPVFKIE